MINFIILGAILGLSAGEGLLPDGPLNASVGGTVLFTTNLNPTEVPYPSVKWTFDDVGQIITSLVDINSTVPEYEDRITLFRSTGSLELRNLKLNDSGKYTVFVQPAVGPEKIGITKLQIYEQVAVDVAPSSVKTTEFSSVSFFCNSSESDVFLWHNGSSEITPSDRVQINITNAGSFLTITNVTRYDQGTYWCNGSNPVSFDNDSASLVVSYGPENIQLKASPVKDLYEEGSEVILTCSAVSVPPAEFSWFQNGTQLPEKGSDLKFSQIQMSHNGSYICEALNSITGSRQRSQSLIINVKKNPPESSPGLSAGAIAGIVIACLVVVAAAAGGGYFIYSKKGNK